MSKMQLMEDRYESGHVTVTDIKKQMPWRGVTIDHGAKEIKFKLLSRDWDFYDLVESIDAVPVERYITCQLQSGMVQYAGTVQYKGSEYYVAIVL